MQNNRFYNNNFDEKLYQIVSNITDNIKLIINFDILMLNCNKSDYSSVTDFITYKFSEIRDKLKNKRDGSIRGESNNLYIYKKMRYIYEIIFYSSRILNDIPNKEIYDKLLYVVNSIFSLEKSDNQIKTEINQLLNNLMAENSSMFPNPFNFQFKIKSEYESKYLKYKNKYLELKLKLNN